MRKIDIACEHFDIDSCLDRADFYYAEALHRYFVDETNSFVYYYNAEKNEILRMSLSEWKDRKEDRFLLYSVFIEDNQDIKAFIKEYYDKIGKEAYQRIFNNKNNNKE